jgi:hypothetical protein
MTQSEPFGAEDQLIRHVLTPVQGDEQQEHARKVLKVVTLASAAALSTLVVLFLFLFLF